MGHSCGSVSALSAGARCVSLPLSLARLIAIEPTTSLALLEHEGAAVLVDLALPLSARPDPEHIEIRGVPRLKSLLTVFGDLNVVRGRDIAAGLTLTPKAEDRRSLDAQVPHAIAFDETVRLCALRFVVEDSLDITLWAKGVEAIRLED